MTDPVINKLAEDLTKAQERGHSLEGVIFVFYLKLFLAMAAVFAVALIVIIIATSIFEHLNG